ncbi:unnamed protein product [Onchocerca flexuosa]|uniref:DNA-directed DNA polymerase n=1 Tax=Onchocerca flexuosa TaxID=387005 RepID=A0A183HSX5_9BILA|nr:unnamed protein product [Onchocerca flexuosa]
MRLIIQIGIAQYHIIITLIIYNLHQLGPDGSGKSATQRAYHLTEVQENKCLKIDFHYYLVQQILPVVSRLCVPIEGCSEAWVAQALGLHSLTYRKHTIYDGNADKEEQPLCFPHYNLDCCESFNFVCPKDGCGHEFFVRECVVQDVRFSLN